MFGLSSQLGSAVIVVLHVRSDRRVAQQGCGAQRWSTETDCSSTTAANPRQGLS